MGHESHMYYMTTRRWFIWGWFWSHNV